jgi:hypothetical protein
MKTFKSLPFGLCALLAMFAGLQACAAEQQVSDADAEEQTTDEAALTANAARLVGAFTFETGNAPPLFKAIVFKSDGTYLADVDTGVRCVVAPCPSGGRISGRYTATASYLTLKVAAGGTAGFSGRYKYTLAIGRETGVQKITLSDHSGFAAGWSNTVNKTVSYCAEPTDCNGQNLITPKCVGSAICRTDNTCGYHCGVIAAADVWPADATKLQAESSGGGFSAPPPAGSTCAIGAEKFALNVSTRNLSWDVCTYVDASTPMHMVSGSRVLTAAEFAKIEKAANTVKPTTSNICGADKPLLKIQVTSPAGTKSYTDSFYSCNGGATKYVDNIDNVFAAMGAAAH